MWGSWEVWISYWGWGIKGSRGGGGFFPPLYTEIWEPGPIHRPILAPPGPEGIWLDEPFDDLTTYAWTITEGGGATVTIVNGRLKLYSPGAPTAAIERADSRAVPTKMDIKILNEIEAGGEDWYFFISNALYMISIHFYAKWDQISIWNGTSWHDIAGIASIEDQNIVWKFSVDGNTLNLYRDDVIELANFTLPATSQADGKMMLLSDDGATSYTDYFTIEDLS